ncbi:MAG: von Willebrand factor type A domain-containing protein [Phycisphaerae bacterium]|nr:von Willebrand factor type A domain-containing protein [Phycisphaerae bacterium]
MHREDAEKLLAAFVFGDLDEGSRAQVAAYLQTDDELRERTADMRMAAKVASDALLDGPEPVLDARRLKHLARLAAQGKRRPVITMRRSALAAGILLVGVLLVVIRPFGVKKMSVRPTSGPVRYYASDGLEDRTNMVLEEAAKSEKSVIVGGGVYDLESREGQVLLKSRGAVSDGKSANEKYNIEFTGGTLRQVTNGLASPPPPPPSPAVAAKPSTPKAPVAAKPPADGAPPAGSTAYDRTYSGGGPNKTDAERVKLLAGLGDGDGNRGIVNGAVAQNGRVTLGRESAVRAAESTLSPPLTAEPAAPGGEATVSTWGYSLDGGGPVDRLAQQQEQPAVNVELYDRSPVDQPLTQIPMTELGVSEVKVHTYYNKLTFEGGLHLDTAKGGALFSADEAQKSLRQEAVEAARDGDTVVFYESPPVIQYNRLSPSQSEISAPTGQSGLAGPAGGRRPVAAAPAVSTPRDAVTAETAAVSKKMRAAEIARYDFKLPMELSRVEVGEELDRVGGAAIGGAAGVGGGMGAPAATVSNAKFSDKLAELSVNGDVAHWKASGEEAGKAVTQTREGLESKSEIEYPRNWAQLKQKGEAEAATATTAPVSGPVGKDMAQTNEARRMLEDVKLNVSVSDKEAIRAEAISADVSSRISDVLKEDESVPVKRLKEAARPNGSDLPPASRFRVMPVNPWVMTEQDHLSTFGLDVDTASYTLCRRYIRGGFLPPAGAVRIEEFVNYFDYRYPQRSEPTFAVIVEGAPSPFAGKGRDLTLLKIAVKARTIGRDQQKAAHLVFVVDTSASMGQADRMPLVQQALDMLISRLSPADRVTVVTCAGEARLVLESVPASERDRIRQAVWAMQPSGTTNLLSGLQVGYAAARRAFVAGRVNHVVLCSDGVANVGETQAEAVLKAVAADRKQGITLTCVGVGYGSYNDAFLETLANQGDGSYVFLDSAEQVQRVFVEQLAATLHMVAKDARIQVEFDPARVRRYRLIGYENRDIADARFRDDTVDAGEVGSGQCSTALYELELTGGAAQSGEDLGTVFVRYRNADSGQIEEISSRLSSDLVRKRTIADSPCFYLAAGAARFAELLRESEHAQNGSLKEVLWIVDQVAAALPLDRDIRELYELIQEAENLPKAP